MKSMIEAALELNDENAGDGSAHDPARVGLGSPAGGSLPSRLSLASVKNVQNASVII